MTEIVIITAAVVLAILLTGCVTTSLKGPVSRDRIAAAAETMQ
jgi:outer membrane murein-binding lipoprotein Lpp